MTYKISLVIIFEYKCLKKIIQINNKIDIISKEKLLKKKTDKKKI